MDLSNTTPMITDNSSPRVRETANALTTPYSFKQLSPKVAELAKTQTLLQEAEAKYNHLSTLRTHHFCDLRKPMERPVVIIANTSREGS